MLHVHCGTGASNKVSMAPGYSPNWPGSMIVIVVVATMSVDIEPSKQFTTVPFRPLLTGLIISLDIRSRGRIFGPEGLKEVNVMSLILPGIGGTPLGPTDVIVALCDTLSGIIVSCHLRKMSDDVHISSS